MNGEFQESYQATLKAKALLAASLSCSQFVNGSNMNACTTIPISPPCSDCFTFTYNLVKKGKEKQNIDGTEFQ